MFEQKDFNFIYKYFIAEKQESLLFLIIGLVALLTAVFFWFFIKGNPAVYKGAAVPVLAIGLIQLVVGYTVYSRTDKQKTDIAYNIGMEPAAYITQTEMPRMKTVMKNFVIYRWVEITLIAAGLILVFLFRLNPEKAFWYGFGAALSLQAVIMLAADFFAEKRGMVYMEALHKIIAD